MGQENKIPTLGTDEISNFHMHSIDWLPTLSNVIHKDFHINRVDDIPDKKKFNVLPHRKTYHDFFYLRKGTSVRSKGLNSYQIVGPAIFFLPAYQITEHQMLSEDAEGFYCHFNENLFNLFPKGYLNERFPFFQYQSNPIISLQPTKVSILESTLERLLLLYQKEHDNKNLIAAYLMSLFEELRSASDFMESQKSKKSNFEITKRYKHALTKHIYEYQTINDYASLLNVTPNYLNKCVKTAIGKTAQNLLKEMLVLEAKTLIRHSNLNFSEIAVKLCNQTPSNFARFFKKQTSLTPKQYAQKN